MTAKERLRHLADELSEEEAATALMLVERRADPMLRALSGAPADDEPSSAEEDAGAAEGLAAYQRGDAVGPDELKRDLGLA